MPEPGYDGPDGASIIDPEGVRPAIGFLRVPEPKAAKNRFHLDIRVGAAAREDTVDALIAAGASVHEKISYDGVRVSHVIMRDPEGNEFCVA